MISILLIGWKKMIKKILILFLAVMVIITIVLGYMVVGYFIRGLNQPILIGDTRAYFVGYHILTLSYFVPFLISLVMDAFLFFKILNTNKKKG